MRYPLREFSKHDLPICLVGFTEHYVEFQVPIQAIAALYWMLCDSIRFHYSRTISLILMILHISFSLHGSLMVYLLHHIRFHVKNP